MAEDVRCPRIDKDARTVVIRAHTRALLNPHVNPSPRYRPYATFQISAISECVEAGLAESYLQIRQVCCHCKWLGCASIAGKVHNAIGALRRRLVSEFATQGSGIIQPEYNEAPQPQTPSLLESGERRMATASGIRTRTASTTSLRLRPAAQAGQNPAPAPPQPTRSGSSRAWPAAPDTPTDSRSLSTSRRRTAGHRTARRASRACGNRPPDHALAARLEARLLAMPLTTSYRRPPSSCATRSCGCSPCCARSRV
jgi:hypothetical protein